ncbi:MAG: hypothetical protein A2908_01560 [Candidatus Staskawiczbacteria bacterium RIFCSPLOWO2_01_FULL_38_12b]|uniref:Uncharacterized protein n=1 Tax=Candidatus Staskawiczbacteria bacterium RIFCSPLOWO2_01_FULL_38_12b TaxID=1802214 RepID=A0A1G2IDH1_9BACT|nr:MAG: hypothetical protein A2908_01560 [Candidatus Staskawiczbacteria bacterium RIFCSPLOWO2_01_FULL_38_12b]
MPRIVGAGFSTENGTVLEIPPPGKGLKTVILGIPAVVISVAEIIAVNLVEETKVVALFELLNLTTDPLTKLLPYTVKVNWPEPTNFSVGNMPVITGTGLFATLTVNTFAFEVPPPGAGLVTTILKVSATVKYDPGITAVNWVEEIKVVDSGSLNVLLIATTDPFTKPIPLTVNVKFGLFIPAIVDVGDMLVIVSIGLSAFA